MPVSALFLIMMGAGGFLVYAAVKNEHPWSLFTTQLQAGSGPAPGQSGFGVVAPGHTVDAQGVAH